MPLCAAPEEQDATLALVETSWPGSGQRECNPSIRWRSFSDDRLAAANLDGVIGDTNLIHCWKTLLRNVGVNDECAVANEKFQWLTRRRWIGKSSARDCGEEYENGLHWLSLLGTRVATPNDPKLSDGGGWRGPCMAGGKAAAEARAVTAGAVRCSAWLGVAVEFI